MLKNHSLSIKSVCLTKIRSNSCQISSWKNLNALTLLFALRKELMEILDLQIGLPEISIINKDLSLWGLPLSIMNRFRQREGLSS